MQSKRRILWVDDDLFYFKNYVEEISEIFDVTFCRGADELIKIVQTQNGTSFSGIIMDIILPHGVLDPSVTNGGLGTGMVLVELLKSTDGYRGIPVVILTIRDSGDVDELGEKYEISVFRKSEVRIGDFITAVAEVFK